MGTKFRFEHRLGFSAPNDRPRAPPSTIGTCLAIHRRPGLMLPNGATFERCESRFVFDPPLSVFEEQQIQVKESWSGTTLPNGQVTSPRPHLAGSPTRRTPIIVTSRATWLPSIQSSRKPQASPYQRRARSLPGTQVLLRSLEPAIRTLANSTTRRCFGRPVKYRTTFSEVTLCADVILRT
jgi:hypothetical protein